MNASWTPLAVFDFTLRHVDAPTATPVASNSQIVRK